MRRHPQGSFVLYRQWQQLVYPLLLLLALLPLGRVQAQEQPSAATSPPTAEVLKYHDMLRRRPQTGVVFDRFMGAWLATGSRDTLREFLLKASDAADAMAADHLILALYYSSSGQDAEALKACERAAQKAPDEPLIHLRTAEIANRLKDWDTALTALTRASQLGLTGESDIRATRLQTDTLWRLGRASEAKDVFHKLIERHPDESSLREELVDMLVENGLKPEAAIESRTLVDLTKDPFEKAMRRLRLADLLLDLRKVPQARTELDLTLAQSGTDFWLEGEALDRMERLYRRSGDVPGFATKLAELAKQHTNRVAIVRRQMRILTEIGKPMDASALAAALLERTPGRQDVREDYINLLEYQGNIREAVQQAEELLRQQPGDSALMLRLAGLHGRNGSPDRTRALVEQFLNQSPDDEGALLLAGRLLERLGLDDAAHDLYEKWMSSHPQDPLAGLSLAALLHRKGDVPDAIALWRKLAAQGDLSAASQIATAAANRGEDLAAFEILKAREQEFINDLRVLTQACNLALQARQETSCVRWLRRYAQLVKDPGELQRLATLTGGMLNRQNIRKLLLDDFAKTPASGISDGLLLAFAHEFTTPENAYDERQAGMHKADELLAQVWKALPHPADAPLSMEETLVEAGHAHVLNRRREWSALLRILSDNAKRPGGKTSMRLQDLAETSAEAFEYDAALRWIAEWKAAAPTSHTPWRLQARLLRSTGQPAKVLEVLREAARRFPDEEDITFQLADALSEAGLASEALATLRELFDQKDDATQRLRIGSQMVRTAKKTNQLDLLLDEWKRNQREHADSPEAWRLLAMVYREKPDVAAHGNALGEALRLSPNDIMLMRELAVSEDARGNVEKAAELYRQAARKDSSPQARRSYADFLLKRGDDEEALQIMQEIASAQTTKTADIEQLADNLMGARLWKEAAALLEEPARSQAQNARLQYQRGVALEESGKLEEAAQHFTRVLLIQEEMVDATPLPPLQEPPLLPEMPGSLWWHRLREQAPDAYEYRGQPEMIARAQTVRRPGPALNVRLPICKEEAQVFALRHLARLAEIGRTQTPELAPLKLPESVPMATLWTNLVIRQIWGRSEFITTAAQVREHPVLLASWLRGNVKTPNLPEEESIALLDHAEQTFSKSHPELAAEAALLHAFIDMSETPGVSMERALEFARHSTASMERLAELSSALVCELPDPYMAGILPRGRLSQEEEKKLLSVLTSWALNASSTDARAGVILSHAACSLATRGHWEGWRKLLDEALPRIRANAAVLAMQASSKEVGAYTFNFLAFPSQIHSGYGINPALCLAQSSSWLGGATGEHAPASLVAEARDPLTRLLCLQASGHEADLKQEAMRLAEAYPTRDDVLFLKASVLAMDGKSEELTKALYQWAALPVTEEVQRSRARYLLSTAVDGSLPADDAIQAVVLAAAKHLVALGELEDQRSPSGIAESLKSAGFVTQGQMLANSSTRYIGNIRSTAQSQQHSGTFTSQIAQAVLRSTDSTHESGTSFQTVTNTLRKFARQEIALGGGYARALTDDGWQTLSQALYRKSPARQALFDHLMKEAGSPRLSHAEGAFIADRLGFSATEIHEHYQKALDQNPGDTNIRLRAICALLDTDTVAAQKLYAAAPLEDRMFIGQSICDNAGRNSLVLTQIASRFMVELLHTVPSRRDGIVDLQWISALLTNLAWSGEGFSAPGISDLLQTEPPAQNGGFGAPLVEPPPAYGEGHELAGDLEELCEAAMEVPNMAAAAYGCYAALKLKKGATVESLAPKAREVLQTGSRANGWIWHEAFSHNEAAEPSHLWQPSPLGLLAWHASKQSDTRAAFRELTSFAQGCKVVHADLIVAALERLYTCQEADFPTAAAELAHLPYPASWWLDAHPTITTARIWKERNLEIDPAQFALKEPGTPIFHISRPSGTGIVLDTLATRGHREQAKAFMLQVMETALGPRAEWREFFKKLGDGYDNPAMQRVDFIHRLMQNICQTNSTLVFLSLEVADESGMRHHPSFRAEYVLPPWMTEKNLYGLPAMRSSRAGLNFLAGSPWLTEGAPFWDCPLDPAQKDTVLTRLASAINQFDKPLQADIRATIEHAAASNPGAAILHALVSRDQQKLVDAIAFANAGIDRASNCSIEALGLLMEKELAPFLKVTAQTRAPKVQAALLKLGDMEAARNAEAFFTARKVEALQMNDEQFEETMRRAATQLASTDRAKAVRLLDRACALMVDKQSRRGWNASTVANGWTASGEALKRWCDKTQSLDVVAVACDLFHQPDEVNAASAGWWNSPSWGGALVTAWKDEGGIGNPAVGLKAMLQSLHSKLAIKKAPLLMLAFMDFHGKLDVWQRQEVLKAADALAKEQTDISLYASWLGLAFRLNDLAEGALWLPGSQDPEVIRGVMEGFRAVIKDESVNPLVRLAVAHNLMNKAGKHADPETIWAAMDLATLAVEKEWPVHDDLMLDILNAVNRLPADGRYKAAATRWLPAWLHRNRLTNGQNYEPLEEYQSAVLTFAARGLDGLMLRQALRSLSGLQQRSAASLLTLIRHERDDVARDFLLQSKDMLLRASYNKLQPEESDMEKVRAFAETLPNPDERVQVMVYCSSFYGQGMLPDLWADSRALSWNRRMAERARQVMEHTFQDAALKDKLMLELADAPAAVMVMEQEIKEKDLREMTRHASFGSGPGSTAETLRYPLELTLNFLVKRIRETPPEALAATGSVFPGPYPNPLNEAQLNYQTLLERIDSGRNSWGKTECTRQVEGNLFESTMLSAPSMSGTSLAGFLPAWHKILRAYADEKERFEEEALGIATQIVLAGLSGKTAEIQAWREDVSHYRRDSLKAQFLAKRHLMPVAQQLCRLENGQWRGFDERWKLVQAFAEDAWVAEYLKSSRDIITQLVCNRVLTIVEALEHAKGLATMFPAEGRVAAELASLMQIHRREDEVATLLTLAVEQAKGLEVWEAEWTLRLVKWKEDHQQRDEAMRLWEDLKNSAYQPTAKKAAEAARPGA
ncbi:tetratricopeptide repeat protein [Roseimicrobium sp. ORNL1]|uniref:tetratricopeptide repeat protein n=1 Tax=Roseimicrobium sp. ORNL1 TaxID=2711231 RepID=UPI0013E144B5|nr:tetratricopeptide repeat protein [Roseimicrobium sp. ORNL1]QIF03040.1 tetratricopeptide repeat protein [Roseimicrobium sp. ORNL1]